MPYEPVIGLEVHSQLITKTKMFCRCTAAYADSPPNSTVCPVCLGMPGVLPVINKKAVEFTVMTGLALGCEISAWAKFDRKNYPYPDLVKGYQISQYDAPFCISGHLTIGVDGVERIIGITRVHLEEDTARLLHRQEESGENHTLVDVNRSGVPLMEIVGEPDLRSALEAKLYLQKLRSILRYLGVSTGNMEEGSFRCDANVSIRPVGATDFGAKVEVKNMNSFRSVERAIDYEIRRQTEVLESGGTIHQETRGWVEERGVTVGQRSKEQAHDYRYFPEPDLPPVEVSRQQVDDIRAGMPELPDAKALRYGGLWQLPAKLAAQLVEDRKTAEYFEAAVAASGGSPSIERIRSVANWVANDATKVVNERGWSFDSFPVTPEMLAGLIDLVDGKTVSVTIARDVLDRMVESGKGAADIVREQGLAQISDDLIVGTAIDAAIAANPKAVEDFHSGKANAIDFLFGQVMRTTKGKADPVLTRALLRERLGAGE